MTDQILLWVLVAVWIKTALLLAFSWRKHLQWTAEVQALLREMRETHEDARREVERLTQLRGVR